MTSFAAVIAIVAQDFGVTAAEVTGTGQEQRVAEPRQIAMYLCRRARPKAGVRRIGDVFGRAGNTVCRSVHLVERRRRAPAIDALLSRLEARLDAVRTPFETKEISHVR
ncbi:MAG: hypothetical protein DI566_13360 [Microbacterium sp.]|nr:MAG: hypothetical protein DI566_13360 [Microbacterium sp.]